jgi:VanZ family protein
MMEGGDPNTRTDEQGIPELTAGKWIRGGCIAVAFFMAVTLFLGAQEIGKVNAVPHWVHKVEHAGYYGLMALLLTYGLGRRWFWIALLAVPMAGAIDEWHQLYVPGRNSSVYDWMADVAGTLVFVYAYYRVAVKEKRHSGRRTQDSAKA